MRNLIFIFTVLTLVISAEARTITVDNDGPADVGGIQSANAEPNVIEEWVARYNGPGNGSEYTEAIAVDSNNNIYVTGQSTGLGFDIAYATVKYSSDSDQPVWVARYNGPSYGIDAAWAIAVDSMDNIYVTGSSDSGASSDYATIKYSPDSNQPVWVARYNGPDNAGDWAYAIAVDSTDNIYVSGCSIASDTNRDYLTIKYASDSNQAVWVARYNGPSNDLDFAHAVAVDSSDNIYVTGNSYDPCTSSDYVTVKYAPDSNQPVWVARYNGPGNGSDWPNGIAVDGHDNIYVTGRSYGSATELDYATVKYAPDSNQAVWVARYDGPPHYSDGARAIIVDSMDNIYVTGGSIGSGTDHDYATIKYSPDSNQPVWVARYNGPDNAHDYAYAIALDSMDNIYVTGFSYASGTAEDYTTIKYSPDSNQPIWVAWYNGPGNDDDHAYAIAIDSMDNVYITGDSYGSATDRDYATIKYSQPYLLPLVAEIRIKPKILNLQSKNKSIICRISLPKDYDVADIDPNSILLEDEIEAERVWLGGEFAVVKFRRREVKEVLGEVETPGEVELVVSGELSDGTIFEGTDTIRVIDKGRRMNNSAGKTVKRAVPLKRNYELRSKE